MYETHKGYGGATYRSRKTRDENGQRLPKSKPKAKKRRKSSHSAGGHLHLEGLLDAPLEVRHRSRTQQLTSQIVHAIFSWLTPIDLTALTRTSRSLRAVLLNRATGLVIFKRSFARLFADGLPVPPKHLSLPAYASLLTIESCSVR